MNYRKTENGRQKRNQTNKRYSKHNSQKISAQNAVNNAIIANRLPRPIMFRCSCGKQAKHYHHNFGYIPEHWFDVIPLCRLCHAKIHKAS